MLDLESKAFTLECRNGYKKLQVATALDSCKRIKVMLFSCPLQKYYPLSLLLSSWLVFSFFKHIKPMSLLDGNMQQYVYRQEPAKKCQRKARITIRYPAFVPRLVIRRRFQRAVGMPTVIQTVRINPYQSGNLCLFVFYTTIVILCKLLICNTVPLFFLI